MERKLDSKSHQNNKRFQVIHVASRYNIVSTFDKFGADGRLQIQHLKVDVQYCGLLLTFELDLADPDTAGETCGV